MPEKITPDGLSSAYHQIKIPLTDLVIADGFVIVENHHIIKHALGNDFDKGNILKALVRLGKKAGTSRRYDLNKIKWTVEKLIQEDEDGEEC